MTRRHALTATLDIDPVVTAAAIAWRLTWRLAVAEGVDGAGPAGAASLQLRPDGVTLWSDYASPERLLQLDVPFGVVPDLPDASDETLQARGAIDDRDAEVVEALLGVSVRRRLTETSQRYFTESISENDAWPVVGRVALASQLLADRHQPITGVWALELAEALASVSGARSVERRSVKLLESAVPALQQLPESSADAVLVRVPELGHLLRTVAFRTGRTLGPAVDVLKTRSEEDLVRALREVVDAAGDRVAAEQGRLRSLLERTGLPDDQPLHRGDVELPVFRGAERDQVPKPTVHVRRDFSADGLVRDASARIEGVQLAITVEPTTPVGAIRRLQVRVTAGGDLVGAALSLSSTSGAGLVARLTFPPHMLADSIEVVVGRELPFEAIDEVAFHERQAIHGSRRLVDTIRRSQIVGSAPDDIDRMRESASDAWTRAGRMDLANLLDDLAPQTPFVAERATALSVARDIPELAQLGSAPGTDTLRLAWARDLAWSLGDLEAAAGIEGRRRQDPSAEPLALQHHDTLVLLLLALGDMGAALDLDARAPAPM